MKISLITPVYNEEKTVAAFLEQLSALEGDWEIILADGGSTDGTADIVNGRFNLLSCPKGRANQMNFAAEHATGDVLWFVHCDSLLPKDAHGEISRAIESGALWGCFHIAFDYDGPFMGCNTRLSNKRARKGIAFGDQGIFVKKQLFFEMGGFPNIPIMEDYEFSLRMKEKNIPITQLPGTIVTSGRRYRGKFPPLTMWQMYHLRCLYRKGVDIEEIARRYKDIR